MNTITTTTKTNTTSSVTTIKNTPVQSQLLSSSSHNSKLLLHPFTWKNGCQVWNNKPLVGTTPPTEHHDTKAPPTGLVVTLLLPSEDPTYQQAIRGLSCNAIPWLAYPGTSWHWWYSLFRRFRIHQSHHFRVVHNLPLPPLGTQVVVVYHWESNRWLAHGQWQRGSSLVVKSPRWVQ
jgi:hypothetical protein